MLNTACIPIITVIPIASNEPNKSGAFIEIITPLQMKIANNTIISKTPNSPISSAQIAKITD